MTDAGPTVERRGARVRRFGPSAYEVAAAEAAEHPHVLLRRQVLREVRWAFTPPRYWLGGLAFNLTLAILWLLVVPLRGEPHRDWAILVGSYFAVWVLADVTTTNALGCDALRVRIGLLHDLGLRRILLIKNLALLAIVGLPTLIATAVVTVVTEAEYRLALTLPGVLFPILTWLGVGNVASIVWPVAVVRWRERWRQRRQLRPMLRWLACLALPYALLGATDPVADLPRWVVRHLPMLPPTAAVGGAVLCVLGLAMWGAGTALALGLNRLRPIRIR